MKQIKTTIQINETGLVDIFFLICYKKKNPPSAKHLAGKFGNRFYKRKHLK